MTNSSLTHSSNVISLNELLQGAMPTNNELTKKYYQIMRDNLIDFLDNVVIDITTSRDKPQIRWIILKDEYDNFNDVISNIVSKMLSNTDDANKMN